MPSLLYKQAFGKGHKKEYKWSKERFQNYKLSYKKILSQVLGKISGLLEKMTSLPGRKVRVEFLEEKLELNSWKKS